MTDRWRWGTLAAATYVTASLLHLQFSIWIVLPRQSPFGTFALADLVPAAAAASAVALAAWIVLLLRRGPRAWFIAGYWMLWAGAVAAVDRLLTFSANEWAHYPQYALIAWLMARAWDPARERRLAGRILFWVALLGAGDEAFQYLWITPGYSHYFDFNDCVANVLGAAAGLLLYYGAGAAPAPKALRGFPLGEVLAIALIALAAKASFQAGLLAISPPGTLAVPPGGIVRHADGSWTLYLQRSPHHFGSWQGGTRRGVYYVLPPAAGLGLALAAGVLFAGIGRRGAAPAREAGGGR